MKSFAVYSVFAILIVIALASAHAKTTEEGFCVVDGHRFEVGDEYAPKGQCVLYTCSGHLTHYGKTCASEAAVGDCKYIPEDLTKPYPQCCPGYEC